MLSLLPSIVIQVAPSLPGSEYCCLLHALIGGAVPV
jgi:hypothetical protein